MEPVIGKIYMRKKGSRATVRKVTAIEGKKIHYEILHGPIMKKSTTGKSSLNNFRRWCDKEIEPQDSYEHLDGATIWPTYIVLGVNGNPLFRCGGKRAKFYLAKNYVTKIDDSTLQFTNDQTEKRLQELYDGELGEFFMAVKNDRCCVCGATTILTRHHVIPKRHLVKIPRPLKHSISNVLFVCMDCHEKYEPHSLKANIESDDPWQYARAWQNHFIEVMKPQFIPPGWDIITIKNVDALYNQESCGKIP